MSSVTVRAAAKINLGLGVGGVRDDGFHPLATVYQAIGLYDDVTVADAESWSLTLETDPRIDASEVPLDDRNIALRAASSLSGLHGLDKTASIKISKGIPVAGGLAGGSADAAATLIALDRLWDLGTSDEELLTLAADLGSDVPFALIGGTAVGSGRGELVTPLEDNGEWWWVLVESDQGLSTPGVYAEFDRLNRDPGMQANYHPGLEAALRSGDPWQLADVLSNDLTPAACSLRPDLEQVRADGLASGALAALLSGSGPTWLFLCADSLQATGVRVGLATRGYHRVTACAAPVAGAHVVTYG